MSEEKEDSLAKQAETIRQLDEACTVIARSWPAMLKSFHDNCIEEGFDKMQSFQLTIALLSRMASGGH